MTDRQIDLEARFRWLPIGAVVSFGAALALGLLLHVTSPGNSASRLLLDTGLVLLMSAPAARMVTAVAERIRRRDWSFVAMAALVTLEIALVMWRASRKS